MSKDIKFQIVDWNVFNLKMEEDNSDDEESQQKNSRKTATYVATCGSRNPRYQLGEDRRNV